MDPAENPPQGGGGKLTTRYGLLVPKDVLSKYQINPELIVRPDLVTMYVGFWGKTKWQRAYEWHLAASIARCEITVQRRLNQDEVNGLTTLVSDSTYSTGFSIAPAMTAGLGYFFYRGRKSPLWDVCYPMDKRRTLFRPWSELRMGAFNLLNSGQGPHVLWRAFVTLSWFYFAGYIHGGVISKVKEMRGLDSDPRLREYNTLIRNQIEKKLPTKTGQISPPPYPPAQQEQQNQRGADEYPLNEFHHSGDYVEENNSTSGFVSDTVSGGGNDTWGRSYGGSNNINNNTTWSSQGESTGKGFWDDDDASPVASDYRFGQSQQPQGSAWDRLRNQNANPSAARQQPGSYPTPFNEQLTEQQKKQAEFDRLVDAERNMTSDSAEGFGRKSGGLWR
ncbi:hypothetical protein BO70DRAFT_366726 [Aspergillus heteromorphus CBS 117.55]|uniref:Endo-1,3(4)-beta-glucanase n=1 Tax=Aspergillus heteromorphus CBS 117.55 TaxID=1448321 RepID=A0A317UYN3_9EURO|nr:uncharacterized protein BO70DRAFT_366726 [Aspergillus heteromorphus CBS 117.55]PWY65602.1 hypothetical protein BO70DRAFT_366726 [Aspergillus heteromorphus CBS 117.55]